MINGITVLLLLILSVGFSQQMLHKQSVIEIEGFVYATNSDRPYNGKVWWKEEGIKFHQNYTDGRQSGPKRGWWGNGKKCLVENHKNGVKDGLWTKWYESGQKEYEGNYKDGEEDGEPIRYFEDGRKLN